MTITDKELELLRKDASTSDLPWAWAVVKLVDEVRRLREENERLEEDREFFVCENTSGHEWIKRGPIDMCPAHHEECKHCGLAKMDALP
ncbi:MAG: hypothetical protein ACR2RF_24960 [Geminicoccaceae bacterium]